MYSLTYDSKFSGPEGVVANTGVVFMEADIAADEFLSRTSDNSS